LKLKAGKSDTPLEAFWDIPLAQLLAKLEATASGLTYNEAIKRPHKYNPNSMARESRFAYLFKFLRLFANPLVIIPLVASIISIVLSGNLGGLIMIAIVLL
jgi:magnesium-transporting ATPase (P-type)